MNSPLKCFVFIWLVLTVSCASSAVSPRSPASESSPVTVAAATNEEPRQMQDVYVQTDTLTEGDYVVEKLKKNVKIEGAKDLTEVSYAVLKKNGKVLAKFDGVYFGLGNATDFGLFPFLGGDSRQLIVSQTVPRGGRHWIVELAPEHRVIYDSAQFGVGREDLGAVDIDRDGRFEVLQEDTAFYGLVGSSMADSPLPTVIFNFDERARKYLPANHLFKDYALKDIDKKSKPLDRTLAYIYAGEEQKGWALFDKEYQSADKEELKIKIAAILKKDPVYRFIYAKTD